MGHTSFISPQLIINIFIHATLCSDKVPFTDPENSSVLQSQLGFFLLLSFQPISLSRGGGRVCPFWESWDSAARALGFEGWQYTYSLTPDQTSGPLPPGAPFLESQHSGPIFILFHTYFL